MYYNNNNNNNNNNQALVPKFWSWLWMLNKLVGSASAFFSAWQFKIE